MKTQITKTDIKRTGTSEKRSFTMKTSAHAFKILSSDLYSDKILAVIRELSSNAFDAHTEADNEATPFFVHLPNKFEPWFLIRDYGVGLSHDDVMNLYSTYFDTTKSDSNDYTGALGLGSKSPFAYAESFSVTSYFEGEKRIYMIDIGEEGIPQINPVEGFPVATDEHNGLEIQLAVKEEDFQTFEYKAKRIYRRYSTLPKVVGVSDFQIERIEYILEGDGWRVIDPKNSDQHSYDKSMAVQGTVAYPIKLASMLNTDREAKYYTLLTNVKVEIDFPIGELNIAPSREALSYDERTSENIIERAKKVLVQIEAALNQKFKDCKTLWEARILWNEVFGSSGYNSNAFHALVTSSHKGSAIKLLWHGQKIDPNIEVQTTDDLKIDGFNVKNDRYGCRGRGGRVKHRKFCPGANNETFTIVASDRVVFFVNDLERGGVVSRIKCFVEAQTDTVEAYLIRNNTGIALANFLKIVGGANVRKASDLPKPDKKTAAAAGIRGNAYKFVMPGSGYRLTASDYWEHDSIDYKAGGYYFPITRLRVMRDDKVWDGQLNSLMEKAKELGFFNYKTTQLCGIPTSQVKKLQGNWINLFDHFADKVEEKTNTVQMQKQIANHNGLEALNEEVYHGRGLVKKLESIVSQLNDTTGVTGVLLSSLKAVKEGSTAFQALEIFSKLLNISLEVKDTVNLLDMWKKIIQTYPMIDSMMDSWSLDDAEAKKLADYMNLVDELASRKALDNSKIA